MASLPSLLPAVPRASSLEARAASDLSFIRSAIERTGRFSAVPGWGGVMMGLVGLAAYQLSLRPGLQAAWPLLWVAAAAFAGPTNGLLLWRKARLEGVSLVRGHGRSFLLGLFPPLVAGAVISLLLFRAGQPGLLPPTWLLLYGTALMSGGAFSVPVVPATGLGFFLLGLVAACAPASWGLPLLALGFGVFHIVFGLWIAVRHGG